MKHNSIKIRNFGPISHIDGDSFIELNKFTFFIGPQGSGKSTIAKLISTFFWLEKSLSSYKIEPEEAQNFFVDKYCAYFGLASNFKKDTELNFVGDKYCFLFKNNRLNIKLVENENYKIPKIMYIPSERNFLSSLPNSVFYQGLPSPLATFLITFDEARRFFNNPLCLPITSSKVKYEYIRESNVSKIIKNDSVTLLENSASGYQSLVPMYLVTKYLAENKDIDYSKQILSVEQIRKLRNLVFHKNSDLSNKDINALIKPKRFINIIEEPEQNLYPSSQIDVLYSLFKYTNKNANNSLFVTTHSPYVINALILALKAHSLYSIVNVADKKLLKAIVARSSQVSRSKYVVYELNESGCVRKLESYDNLPTDQNILNKCLESFNSQFDRLLDIEDEYAS